MIHHKPQDYPQPHLASQHRWLADKWDKQNRIPEEAHSQSWDTERRILTYELDGELHEVTVQTPPLWVSKR